MADDAAFTDWLLTASTPSIRYLTLTRLMNTAPEDQTVQDARRAIMAEGPVPAILGPQTAAGHWPEERNFYQPKYTSTHWSLLLLTECMVDGADARFRRGVEFMLADTADRIERDLAASRLDLACLFGNILRYALHAGTLDDPRTQRIAGLVAASICNGGCRCQHNWGLGCGWGVARALWGLAAIPEPARSPAINAAIEQGVDFLLRQHALETANYPTDVEADGKIHPLWFRLNFPLFYQVDILFVLRVLAELNALDHPGAANALAWLQEKRRASGRWQSSSPYRSRTWQAFRDRMERDRWVSLHAALILERPGNIA